MFSKINRSSFFLSAIVSLIYAVCWILLSIFFNMPAAFQFLYGFLYISVPFIFVFILMRTQINRFALVQSELKAVHENFENRVQSRTAELEKSIDDMKTLKGIITICANCKSIRNGQEQWEPVESYIQRHTEAEFSHGLCRDCQNALYGENYSRFKKNTSH